MQIKRFQRRFFPKNAIKLVFNDHPWGLKNGVFLWTDGPYSGVMVSTGLTAFKKNCGVIILFRG